MPNYSIPTLTCKLRPYGSEVTFTTHAGTKINARSLGLKDGVHTRSLHRDLVLIATLSDCRGAAEIKLAAHSIVDEGSPTISFQNLAMATRYVVEHM